MYDDSTNAKEWKTVAPDAPATKDQRRACYRLGLGRPFVRKLTTTDASMAIAAMIDLRQRIGASVGPPPSPRSGEGL
ncbi:MAG: hypothetical protein JWO31_2501 [Phycisphaerales bacterium]|nr:hypothetical protein [Phycisphaerales bacterium]